MPVCGDIQLREFSSILQYRLSSFSRLEILEDITDMAFLLAFYSYTYLLSFFGVLGVSPKDEIGRTAYFELELAVQVPCLLRCKTHAIKRISSILRGLHREGANLVRANLSSGSAFSSYWHHILCECRQFLLIVEPLELVGAIPLDIAITVPSKAE